MKLTRPYFGIEWDRVHITLNLCILSTAQFFFTNEVFILI